MVGDIVGDWVGTIEGLFMNAGRLMRPGGSEMHLSDNIHERLTQW